MLAQRICCWIVSNARCHTEAPLHQEATAEEIPPSEEAALGKGRSAGAGSRRTIVTLVGCRVLPWLAFIGSNCIFKAVWVPSPSATGLIDCRECVCGRGLLKAPPRTSLQPETQRLRDVASPHASLSVPRPPQLQDSSCWLSFLEPPLNF